MSELGKNEFYEDPETGHLEIGDMEGTSYIAGPEIISVRGGNITDGVFIGGPNTTSVEFGDISGASLVVGRSNVERGSLPPNILTMIRGLGETIRRGMEGVPMDDNGNVFAESITMVNGKVVNYELKTAHKDTDR